MALEIKTVVICNASGLGSKVTSHFCLYSFGQFRTDSRWPASACLAYFDERFDIFGPSGPDNPVLYTCLALVSKLLSTLH